MADSWVELPELLDYFDIGPEDAKLIVECHKKGHGIEGAIYEHADLHYAYQALTVCEINSFMTSEQIGHAQYWIKAIILGLMQRSTKTSTFLSSKKKANKDKDDSGDEVENSENEEGGEDA